MYSWSYEFSWDISFEQENFTHQRHNLSQELLSLAMLNSISRDLRAKYERPRVNRSTVDSSWSAHKFWVVKCILATSCSLLECLQHLSHKQVDIGRCGGVEGRKGKRDEKYVWPCGMFRYFITNYVTSLLSACGSKNKYLHNV